MSIEDEPKEKTPRERVIEGVERFIQSCKCEIVEIRPTPKKLIIIVKTGDEKARIQERLRKSIYNKKFPNILAPHFAEIVIYTKEEDEKSKATISAAMTKVQNSTRSATSL